MQDIAMNKLRPSLVASAIDTMYDTGISLYIHGPPGIAKSAIARQSADRRSVAFIDFRLSQTAPEDIRGVPMLGEIDGMKGLMWTPPLVFPRDLDYQRTETVDGRKTIRFFNPVGNNGIHYCTKPVITVTAVNPAFAAALVERGLNRFTVALQAANGQPASGEVVWSVTGTTKAILALEEFNSAPPSVMAASYQLILDRRSGDYVVPVGVMLIAMGNRDGDRGVTFKLPKPVANRFVHLEMMVDFEDWMIWAIRNKIHPDVVGYLSRWPSKLMEFNPDSPVHSFATPRAWEAASKIISLTLLSEVKRALVCGAIGDATGTEFLMHCEFMADMPDAQGILDGTVTTFRPKNKQYATQITYSTAVQLLYLLNEQNDKVHQKYPNKQTEDRSPERKQWMQGADRALGYMMEFFLPEVTVVALRMGMTTYKLRFSELPHYKEFAKVNRDLFF